MTLQRRPLPPSLHGRSPTILACGAWLKNSACLLAGNEVSWTPLHGDLDDPANCVALETSVAALLAQARSGHRIEAVAHDLHPDFFSTRLALQVADALDVPAIAVQHHHAHIGVLMAEYALQGPVIGLALDGVGLGSDGLAWGGELLWVEGPHWQRLGHLQNLPLPGGDVAAREPWRMAAAALYALGRNGEVTQRMTPAVGEMAAKIMQAMLARDINCPLTSAAGRWFDAAAGALGLSVRQTMEAEAAIALEKMATNYLALHGDVTPGNDYRLDSNGILDLRPLLSTLFALADSGEPHAIACGAALFHLTLVEALTEWADQAAHAAGSNTIALGGGCFLNRILQSRLSKALARRGHTVWLPQQVSCGDSGLALGQAWVAREQAGLTSVRSS